MQLKEYESVVGELAARLDALLKAGRADRHGEEARSPVLKSFLRRTDTIEREPLNPGKPTIAIGSDHAGFKLKEIIHNELEAGGYEVHDFGTMSVESCDYPDFALKVAEAVSSGEAGRGVLVCATGAGMAIVANKVPGIRAVCCVEPFTAEHCRLHNDANVLTLGSRITDEETAIRLVEKFLSTPFEGENPGGSRHSRRVDRVREVERKYMKA